MEDGGGKMGVLEGGGGETIWIGVIEENLGEVSSFRSLSNERWAKKLRFYFGMTSGWERVD